MAAGSDTISTVPSSWTHGPKNSSLMTQSDARGSRRRLWTFIAVSRVLTTTKPSSSTAAVTGDVWGRPSAREVTSTARWCSRRNSRAVPTSTSLGRSDAGGVVLQLVHGPLHDAAGGLGGHAEHLADLAVRALLAVEQPEAVLDRHLGPGLEAVEQPGHHLLLGPLDHDLLGSGHGVGDEVDELLLAVVADGPVERGGGGQAVEVGELVVELVALPGDRPEGGPQLGRPLAREADEVGLLVERPADGLADPEGGVGGELEALPP